MGMREMAKLLVVKKHWIQVGEERERERIIALLYDYGTMNYISEQTYAELVEAINFSGNKE